MFLVSLSPSPLSQPLWFIFHRHLDPPPPPPPDLPCLALFLSLLQCLSLPVRSGKNTAEGRNGILWPEATRRHPDNGGTSFFSAPPWSGSVVVSGQQTQSARGFYRTLKVQDPYSRRGVSRIDEGGVYGLMSMSLKEILYRETPQCLCSTHLWTFTLHVFPHPDKKVGPSSMHKLPSLKQKCLVDLFYMATTM